MRIRIADSEILYKQGEVQDGEYARKFENKMVLAFDSFKDAYLFAQSFKFNFLVPKYGMDGANKFPMTKTGPADSADEKFAEMLGLKPSNPIPDTWLLIPKDRYAEVEDFLEEKYVIDNPDVEIQHPEVLISNI